MIQYLIVGLGNPGSKYKNTRHNIGWMVVEGLCNKYNVNLKSSLIYHYSILKIKNIEIVVAIPTTYMNASGEAVLKLKKKYDLSNDKIIVISDEFNFNVGQIHLRKGGSDGGHNGLSSIIYELEADDFYRLRCGIGKNFAQGELVDYVLSPFGDDETENLHKMIDKSIYTIESICNIGLTKTMNNINNSKFWEKYYSKSE